MIRTMRWPIGLLLLLTGLTACPRIDTGDDGGTGPITAGPEGGIFIRAGYAIEIPRGALSQETQITVTVFDTNIPEVEGRKRISYGYRFSPMSLTFASPVKIFLPWVAERVPEAVDQNTFDMRRQAGADAFLALPNNKTSMLGGVSFVEATTERLGVFWVTSPSEPNIDRLEITPSGATLNVNDTQQFSAKVIAPTGEEVAIAVSWSVVPARAGSIDENGLFTARAPGVATLSAGAGMMRASVTINVFGDPKGPVTYVHENPFPTGNDLYGGALVPGGFGTVFSGANDTMLARDLNGAWSRLFSTPGVVLKGIAGTTAENAVAIGAQGTNGVLVQFKGANAAPAVSVYRTVEPRQVWFDGTHGMAAGIGNDVLIFRANAGGPDAGLAERSWQTEYSPSFEPLLDVIGDGEGRFVTVGSRGSVYQWDPVRNLWDSLYQTQLATMLTAAVIMGPSGGEIWAVGGAKLWHFMGTGWVPENLPNIEGLAEATSIETFDHRLFIGLRRTMSVTVTNPGLILSYALAGNAAGEFQSFDVRKPQIPRGVFGGGEASTAGFVVGDLGAVYEWQHASATFTEVSHGFYQNVRDLAVVPNDVIATVNECFDTACLVQTGRVMHRARDGGFEPLGTQGFAGPLYAVIANSTNDVLVSAETTSWHYDGTAWSTIPVNPSGQFAPILDFKRCGARIYGVGVAGGVYSGSTVELSTLPAATTGDLYSLWCPFDDDSELWAAGDGVMTSRFSGSARWVARTSSAINQADWRAVWAPGGGEGFAYGIASYGLYWNTANLSTIEPLPIRPDVINAVWGSAIDNLYAVGLTTQPLRFGFAMRFNGVQWGLIDSGSQRNVTAIDGIAPNDIWLGTEGGGLLRAVRP